MHSCSSSRCFSSIYLLHLSFIQRLSVIFIIALLSCVQSPHLLIVPQGALSMERPRGCGCGRPSCTCEPLPTVENVEAHGIDTILAPLSSPCQCCRDRCLGTPKPGFEEAERIDAQASSGTRWFHEWKE